MPEPSPSTRLSQVVDVFRIEDGQGTAPKSAANLAESLWPIVSAAPATAADAELCRLAMLSCAMAGDWPSSRVWRARSLARAAGSGWREGIATLVMSDGFSLLAQTNEDYTRGRTLDVIQPAPSARLIMAEALTALPRPEEAADPPGPTAPTVARVHRLIAEKTGFLLMLEGDWEGALAQYKDAAEFALGEQRGELKVALGAEIVRYLQARSSGSDTSDALERTRSLAADASRLEIADVAAAASHNVGVMESNALNLLPYEIL